MKNHTKINIKPIILFICQLSLTFSRHRILENVTLTVLRYKGSGSVPIQSKGFVRMDGVSQNLNRINAVVFSHIKEKFSYLFLFYLLFCNTLHQTYFNNQLNAQFLYSITICMLHYNPRHVSSINMPIFRRTNFIITASGIVTLCTVQYSI